MRNAEALHPLDDLAAVEVEDLEFGAFLAGEEHPTVLGVDREMVEITGISGQVD